METEPITSNGAKKLQDELSDLINNKNEVNWRSLYEVAQSWEKPSFALTAKDVINMGISQGPMVGDILKEVEDWWAENDFIDDKFSLIERLKAIVQSKK